MTVHQLIYYSRNTITKAVLSPLATVRDIVSTSQINNRRDSVTGFLIFDRVYFLQVLEGDRSIVSKTFARIERDSRHADVVVLGTREMPARLFPDWTMGGCVRSMDQDEIFLSHGIGKTISPSMLNADLVVALARELQTFQSGATKIRALG